MVDPPNRPDGADGSGGKGVDFHHAAGRKRLEKAPTLGYSGIAVRRRRSPGDRRLALSALRSCLLGRLRLSRQRSTFRAAPNQVVNASSSPPTVPSPTQVTWPSGRTSTAAGVG